MKIGWMVHDCAARIGWNGWIDLVQTESFGEILLKENGSDGLYIRRLD
jgi:hypothetical protein